MSEPVSPHRRILLTSALPYANGPIHIGHLVEYVQTDIWARFQRSLGNEVTYICADDTHGTAIMMRARREGRTEVELIAEMRKAHVRDFAGFDISFDYYGSTDSEENRARCHEVWSALRQRGLVLEKEVEQLFDPKAGVFLADRFVKGTCPKCGAADQYGDSCEKCGAAYSATDLKNPYSVLTGAIPELRKSAHLFVDIEQLRPDLLAFLEAPGRLQPEILNYLKGHFLADALRPWDVSRPAPYFGFEIPDAPGNYWYVWFDAPIGYIGATEAYARARGETADKYFKNPEVEVVHFIGKDITYFHTLFWPALLQAAGYQLPRRVQIHGFLTVGGEKMSKSRGTLVKASAYLKHLDPSQLRYFYASKLSDRVDDMDLEPSEFIAKVNSDLVGKVVNLASRTARFVTRLSEVYPEDEGLFAKGREAGAEIRNAYDTFDFARAMRLTMALCDRANEYIDRKEPWKLKKDPEKLEELRDVVTVALSLYRQIIVYLSPVVPRLAALSAELLRASTQKWVDAEEPLVAAELGTFQPLLGRADLESIEKMIQESREEEAQAQAAGAKPGAIPGGGGDDGAALSKEPIAGVCTIDDLAKIDLRVARVIQAEHVPEAKKLLRLTVSLGGDDRRTIFAGIKAAYQPEQLVGRQLVMVANLAPRQMKFGLSEGMVLCAGEGESDLFVLSPDAGAKTGQRLR